MRGSDTPLLSVQDLSVAFRLRRSTVVALDGISFDIAPGEILGVVGEFGAGKSVTGAAIMGLVDPPGHIVGGRVLLDGQRIDDLPEAAMGAIRGRRIGMIFQDPLTSLNPLFTIGDQLVETLRAHLELSRRAARARAVEILAEVGIAAPLERLGAYPHEFSGGMRQRVVIALALCSEPRLVIADEPTTALDVSVQAQILDLLQTLCRERGTSVMLITHDMGVVAEVAEVADRVAVMYAGRIAEIGPVDAVVEHPAHPYAQGLMAAIPSLERATEELEQIPGSMPRLAAPAPDCAFWPRCPHAFAACRERPPVAFTVGPSLVACHLHDPALATTP